MQQEQHPDDESHTSALGTQDPLYSEQAAGPYQLPQLSSAQQSFSLQQNYLQALLASQSQLSLQNINPALARQPLGLPLLSPRYLADIPVGHTASLNPLVAPARADLLMANRIFDEASLLQAAAILQQQQFQQHQQTLLAQANLLAMQQAESSAFLARAASQVPLLPVAALSAQGPQPSDSSAASKLGEPARPQFPESMASPVSSSSPTGGPSVEGPRNLKQERTAQNFLRGCARLRMIQDTERGMLFARKRRWKDFAAMARQQAATVGRYVSLWKTSIQTIEARHGSNVSLTLYFLRFSMGINAAIAAFWLGGTVIPFIISPPSSFSWAYFKAYRPTDLLQGYGLHNTFLLYGGYNYGANLGGWGKFQLDISFPLEIIAMFFFTLMVLLGTIHKRLRGTGDSAFVGQNKLFPFSTVVFTSWDYHLTDVKAARNLRNSIRNQLAEMVFDAELADAYITKSKRIISILLKVFGLLVVWPLMVCGTAAATYLIVTNNDLIIQRTGFGFAPLIMLSLVGVISNVLCTMSVLTEDWHPRMRTNVRPWIPS